MSKRALITGITGQDGPYMAQILLREGYDVYGMTRRVSHQNLDFLSSMGLNDIKIVEGDLSDYSSLCRLINNIQPHEVYNFAAQSHVHTSFDQPEMTSDITGLGVLRLLDVIKKFSNNDTKFYQASSSEMFGNNVSDQNEDSVFSPRSPYASAKVFAHYITKVYRESYGMFASCGILFNHESERRGERFVTRKISKFIGNLLRDPINCPPLQLGYLYAKRDWGYAPDYMEAVYKIMQHNQPDDFVIATGKSYTVKDFCNAALDYVGIDYKWVGEDIYEQCWIKNGRMLICIDQELYRPAEVPYLCGDATKAYNLLGWNPTVDFNELVQIMVNHDVHATI